MKFTAAINTILRLIDGRSTRDIYYKVLSVQLRAGISLENAILMCRKAVEENPR